MFYFCPCHGVCCCSSFSFATRVCLVGNMDHGYIPLLCGDISNHIVGSLKVCKICMICKTSGESSAGGGPAVAKSCQCCPHTESSVYLKSCPTWTAHKATMDAAGLDFSMLQDLPHPSSMLLGNELQTLGVPLGDRLGML
jgi:hypothetical protein